MRLIVLEGTDGAGKTTALAHLTEILGNADMFSCHWSAPAKGFIGTAKEYWQSAIARYLSNPDMTNNSLIIWDRSIIGNLIYGYFKKDQITLTLDDLKDLLSWIDATFEDIHFYLLKAQYGTLEKRLKKTKESYVTPKEAFQIQIEYEALFQLLNKWAKKNNLKMRFHQLAKDEGIETTYKLLTKHI